MLMPPICYTRGCKHYRGISQPDGTEATEVYVCEAFPDGIPKDWREKLAKKEQVRSFACSLYPLAFGTKAEQGLHHG